MRTISTLEHKAETSSRNEADAREMKDFGEVYHKEQFQLLTNNKNGKELDSISLKATVKRGN